MSNAVAPVRAGTEGEAETAVVDPAGRALEAARPLVEQAHTIMQAHIGCSTALCQHRTAALAVLVEAGRYVLR